MVFDARVGFFAFLVGGGATHAIFGELVADIGIRRPDGSPLPAGTISGGLSRSRERAAARRAGRPGRGRHAPTGHCRARWKAHYAPATAKSPEQRIEALARVAALLGHATNATATNHYGRPWPGECGFARFPLPVPAPQEVARIRPRLHLNLQRLADLHPQAERYWP